MMTEERGQAGTAPVTAQVQVPTKTRPEFELRALLGDSREAIILHRGERYLLRVTANGKLILTK